MVIKAILSEIYQKDDIYYKINAKKIIYTILEYFVKNKLQENLHFLWKSYNTSHKLHYVKYYR